MTRSDFTELREDNISVRSELRDIRFELKEMRRDFVKERRWLLFEFLAVNLSIVGIVLVSIKLL